MSDCLPSINFPSQYSSNIHPKLGFTSPLKLPKHPKFTLPLSNKRSFTLNSTRDPNAVPFPSDEHEYQQLDFGLMAKGIDEIRFRRDPKGNKMEDPAVNSGIIDEAEDLSIDELFEFTSQMKANKLIKEDDIAKLDSQVKELERHHWGGAVEAAKSRRQMMRRSHLMAKQVISICSALSLGFVSQLWVDTGSWVVVVVEVRPKLLSGDFERLLLKDVTKVGDVILIEDEKVIEDDFKMVGLETLVGYNVVTPSRQSIGKVRGYTFNINSGSVESLELDSFGISIIPSSLVSTYALYVEDVLEVLSDTVVVREEAVSHIQRLTKGFWDGQNAGDASNALEDPLDTNDEQGNAGYSGRRSKNSRRKLKPKMRKTTDEWELPMDYF